MAGTNSMDGGQQKTTHLYERSIKLFIQASRSCDLRGQEARIKSSTTYLQHKSEVIYSRDRQHLISPPGTIVANTDHSQLIHIHDQHIKNHQPPSQKNENIN